MRVLIYGAGAIGGYLGALLSDAGTDVILLARGSALEAIKSHGVQIDWALGQRQLRTKPKAGSSDEIKGDFDLIFVTLKSMQLAASAKDIVSRLAPGGAMVMIQNGLPWWYFDGVDSPWRGTTLRSLDPDGVLHSTVPTDRVVGAVIHKPVTVTSPGHLFIPDVPSNRLIVGEVDNLKTPRLHEIANLVGAAGLPVEVTEDIRAEKWIKLMVNLIWNPLTALTQSPSGYIASFPLARELVQSMIAESNAVAASLGLNVQVDAHDELQRVAENFKQIPSMLQDVRAGRPLEWQAILGAVIEIAALTSTPVPTLKNIAACVGVLDQHICATGHGIGPIIQ
jgi:2-dehydropantoate 2-reductase